MSVPQNTIALDLRLRPNAFAHLHAGGSAVPGLRHKRRAVLETLRRTRQGPGFRQRTRLHEGHARLPRDGPPHQRRTPQTRRAPEFLQGPPEMFEEFKTGLLTTEHETYSINVEHYIVSSGLKVLIEGSTPHPPRQSHFSAANLPRTPQGRITFFPAASSATPRRPQFLFRINKGMLDMQPGRERPHAARACGPSRSPTWSTSATAPPTSRVSPSCADGGQAIAVYNSEDPSRASFKKCYQLSTHADRVKKHRPLRFPPRQPPPPFVGRDGPGNRRPHRPAPPRRPRSRHRQSSEVLGPLINSSEPLKTTADQVSSAAVWPGGRKLPLS